MSSPAHAITEETPLWVQRWSARAWLWNHTTIQRVRNCGRAVQAATGNVSLLRYPSGQIVATGLQSCKSIWSCPVCSARIVERRAVQLQKVVETWHERGGRVGFLTLTVRHTAKQSLSEVWQLVMDSWRRLIGSVAWREDQKNWGVPLPGRGGRVLPRIPTVRTVEVTHGRHGWHVHLHVLVFFDGGGESKDRWDAISGSMVSKWSKTVRSFGGRVDVRKGTCAELIDPDADASARIGDYLAKAVFVGSADHSAIHWEAAGGRSKTSERTGGLTPWELLDAASHGDQKAAKLWTVWENESSGRRQMWINGTLLDLAGLRDTSDAEALDESPDQAENWLLSAGNLPLCQNTCDQPCKVHKPIGPPDLVGDLPVTMWRVVDSSHRIGTVMLNTGYRGDLANRIREMGVPIRHGTEPAWDSVVVPWREWTASFRFGEW